MLIDASRMTRLTLRSPLFDIAATLSDSGAIRRIDLVADPGQRRPSGPGSLILDDVETNAIILLNAQGHAWRRLGRFRRHIHILRKWTERLKISLAEYVDWRESGRRLDLSQSRAGHRPGTSTR